MPADHAITFTAHGKAELLPITRDPAPPRPDHFDGTTLASLVSPGTELAYWYTGSNFPVVPGYACVFRVDRVADNVKSVKVGDHVFAMGSHQSYQQAHVAESCVLPKNLSPQIAVLARLMGVTMSTLTTTAARPPGKVLVTGLGPVGYLGAKMFELCGYDVTAVDPVEPRRQFASRSLNNVVAKAPAADSPEAGFDLVLECSGHEQAVVDGASAVRKGGEVVLVGVPWKRKTDLHAFDLLHPIFHKYAVVRSGWEWELPRVPADFRKNSMFGPHGNFTAALRWLAEGKIQTDGLFAQVSPRDAQKVYDDLLHQRSASITAVFDWTKV